MDGVYGLTLFAVVVSSTLALPFSATTPDGRVFPPRILNQTSGPLYIWPTTRGHQQYTPLWCNTTEGANVNWTHNGDLLDPSKTGSSHQFVISQPISEAHQLEITQVASESMPLLIQCTAWNGEGAAYGETVNILEKEFQIKEPDTDITVVEGTYVTFSCPEYIHQVPRVEAHSITWYFMNNSHTRHKLQQGPRFKCSQQMDTCVMSYVTTSDTGTYMCDYRVDVSEQKSKQFHLDVLKKHVNAQNRSTFSIFSEETSTPNQINAIHGSEITLQCEFVDENRRNMLWTYRKRGSEACEERKLKQSLESTFTIQNFTGDDEGIYTCHMTQGHNVHSRNIDVRYVSLPILESSNEKLQQIVGSGSTIEFRCPLSVTANPPASIAWRVNLELVSPGGLGHYTFQDGGHTLVLHDAIPDDSGSVTCNVSNDVGYALGYRSVIVVDHLSPEITVDPAFKPPDNEISNVPGTTSVHQGLQDTLAGIDYLPFTSATATSFGVAFSDQTHNGPPIEKGLDFEQKLQEVLQLHKGDVSRLEANIHSLDNRVEELWNVQQNTKQYLPPSPASLIEQGTQGGHLLLYPTTPSINISNAGRLGEVFANLSHYSELFKLQLGTDEHYLQGHFDDQYDCSAKSECLFAQRILLNTTTISGSSPSTKTRTSSFYSYTDNDVVYELDKISSYLQGKLFKLRLRFVTKPRSRRHRNSCSYVLAVELKRQTHSNCSRHLTTEVLGSWGTPLSDPDVHMCGHHMPTPQLRLLSHGTGVLLDCWSDKHEARHSADVACCWKGSCRFRKM